MRLIWLRRNSAHKYKRHRHTQRSFHLRSRDNRMKTGWQQCSRDHTFASLQKQSSAIFIALSTQESNTEALQDCGDTWWQNNHQHLFRLLKHAYGKRTIKWLLRVKACLPQHNTRFIRGPVPAPHTPVGSLRADFMCMETNL